MTSFDLLRIAATRSGRIRRSAEYAHGTLLRERLDFSIRRAAVLYRAIERS